MPACFIEKIHLLRSGLQLPEAAVKNRLNIKQIMAQLNKLFLIRMMRKQSMKTL
jgi:hypothetical protein